MDRRSDEAFELLTSRQVLFSCEGTAERVIIAKLVESERIVVPPHNVVRDMDGIPYTTLRRAKDIQREFLGMDYPDGLLIARIVDTNPGKFALSRPYRLSDIRVLDFITSPEIERLILVKENEIGAFQGRRGRDRQLNASDWCVQHLGYSDVKSEDFLKEYWKDADELVRCIRQANATLGGAKKSQLGLVNLLPPG